MIKHCQTTLISFGDGDTAITTGINAEGEGLIRMYNDLQRHDPGTESTIPPLGAIEAFPDLVMLFRTTKDVDFQIKRLKILKKLMKEEAEAKKGEKK